MIYRFKLLSDENDNFVRDYEVDENMPLADFHRFICADLHFDATQMASFFTAGPLWEKEREYTLFDMGAGMGGDPEVPTMPMDGVRLADVAIRPHDRLIWLFDLFAERALFMDLMEIAPAAAGMAYPRVAAAEGPAPDQFGDGSEGAENGSGGSIFDDVMAEFSGFEGDDSYDDE